MLKHMKKALKFIVACSMAVGLSAYIPEIAPKEIKATEYLVEDNSNKWSGTVSLDAPRYYDGAYHIFTGEELAWVSEQYSLTNAFLNEHEKSMGYTFILERDIDLDNKPWTPIGKNVAFYGVFDGNGKTISNLHISTTGNLAGFFIQADQSIIKNIRFLNVTNEYVKNQAVGVVLGSQNMESVILSNIEVEHATLTGDSCLGGIAGVVGCINPTIIENCSVKNSVFNLLENTQAGGMAGKVINYTSISNCISYNNIFNTCEKSIAGGIVGNNSGGSNSFLNCYSKNIFKGFGECGGLFGGYTSRKISNCYDNSIYENPSDTTKIFAGGIAARHNITNEYSVTNVYYNSKNIDKAFGDEENENVADTTNILPIEDEKLKQIELIDQFNQEVPNLSNKQPDLYTDITKNYQIQFSNWEQGSDGYPTLVPEAVNDIEVIPSTIDDMIYIPVSSEFALKANIKPFDAIRMDSNVMWSIPSESGIVIDNNGKINTMNAAVGTETTLEVKYKGINKRIKIKVVDKYTNARFKIVNPNNIPTGSVKKLFVDSDLSDNELKNIEWYISQYVNGREVLVTSCDIASIDTSTGIISTKQAGTVRVVARIKNSMIEDSKVIHIGNSAWDGISSEKPELIDRVWHIKKPSELKYISDAWRLPTRMDFSTSYSEFYKYVRMYDVVLDENLDMGGLNNAIWTPIGEYTQHVVGFSKKFDGNGHTISNLLIDGTKTNINGLFGWINGGTVQNLILENPVIVNGSSESYSGGLVGQAQDANIINVSVINPQIESQGISGGLLGFSQYNTVINQCTSEMGGIQGRVTGGLVGEAIAYNGIIMNSYSTSTVTGIIDRTIDINVGGLVGSVISSTDSSLKSTNSTPYIIQNSYAQSKVISNGTGSDASIYTGGLIGVVNSYLTLENNYVSVPITNQMDSMTPGGLIGYAEDNADYYVSIANNTWDEDQVFRKSNNAGVIIIKDKQAIGKGYNVLTGIDKRSNTFMKSNEYTINLNDHKPDPAEKMNSWTHTQDTLPYYTYADGYTIVLRENNFQLRKNENKMIETIMTPFISDKKITYEYIKMSGSSTITVNDTGLVSVSNDSQPYQTAIICMIAKENGEIVGTENLYVTVLEDEQDITSFTIKDPGRIEAGQTVQLEALIEPNTIDTTNVKWRVKEINEFADVSIDGVLTAKDAGTFTVLATLNGHTAERIITIQSGLKWDGVTVEEPKMEGDNIYISKASELAWLAWYSYEKSYNFEGKNIYLMNDIDLNNKVWTPIGTISNGIDVYSQSFRGNFDGQNHIIKNLCLNNELPESIKNVEKTLGLFGYVGGNCEIKNIIIENAEMDITEGIVAAGFLCGNSSGSLTIENVKIKNIFISDKGTYKRTHKDLGLMVGNTDTQGYSTKIENSQVENAKIIINLDQTTNFSMSLGGIVSEAGSGTTILNCSVNNMNINISSKGIEPNNLRSIYIGGILSIGSASINNCYAEIEINGDSDSEAFYGIYGGLIGDVSFTPTIDNSYAVFTIDEVNLNDSTSLKEYKSIGALIGNLYPRSELLYNNVYYNADKIGALAYYGDNVSSLHPPTVSDEEKAIMASNVVGMTTSDMQAGSFNENSLVSKLNAGRANHPEYAVWTVKPGAYPTFATIEAEKVTIQPKEKTVYAGEIFKVEKQILPMDAKDVEVIFSSNDERVMVDQNGNVRIDSQCIEPYVAIITMTPTDTKYLPTTSTITVLPEVDIESIKLNAPTILSTNKDLSIPVITQPNIANPNKIKWSVTNTTQQTESISQKYATFLTAGHLRTGSFEQNIIVRAESVDDPSIYDEAVIQIKVNPSSVWDGTTTAIQPTENEIHITTPRQLAYIAEQCSSGVSYENVSIYLDADLNLGGHPWMMIGRDNYPFKGKFYGNNHTISNLYLVKDDKAMAIGLFGAIQGAEIHDLNLDNVASSDLAADEIAEPIGCLIGKILHSENQSIIKGCHIENATITHSSKILMGGIGGLVGVIDGKSYIDRSSVSKSNLGGNYNEIGGLIGTITSNADSITITNCYVKDTDNVTSSQFGFIGTWDDTEGYVSNCHINGHEDFGSTLYLILKTSGDKVHRIENCYLFINLDTPTLFIEWNSSKNTQIYHSYYVNSNKSYGRGTAPAVDESIKLPESEMFYGIDKPNSMVNQLNDWVSKQSDPSQYMTWVVRNSTPELVNPSSISFDVNEYTLKSKDTLKLIPKVKGDYLNTSLYWTSNYPSVAYVDQQGNVKALVPGYAIITATTQDGQKARVNIHVRAQTNSVQLGIKDNPTNEALDIGDITEVIADMQPADDTLTWSISGDCIEMSINEADNKKVTIRAIKGGTATITAETPSGITGTLEVSVSSYPRSIQIKEGIDEIGVDNKIDHLQLTILFTPDTATNRKVTFESSNTDIAVVDADGLITFKKESDGVNNKLGETLITVTPQVNPNAPAEEQAQPVKIKIQVNNQVIPIEELVGILTNNDTLIENAVIRVGSEIPLYVKYNPSTATSRDFTWSVVSGSENIAIENNMLKGLKEGKATLRVSVNGLVNGLVQEISLEKEITVQAAQASDIVFDKPSISLKPNESIEVNASIYPSVASQAINWKVKAGSEDIVEIVQPKSKSADNSTITIKANKDAPIGTSGIIIAESSDNALLQKELPVYIIKNSATSVNVSNINDGNSEENPYQLKVGQSVEFNAIVYADDQLATNQNVTWTSSDNQVALVEISTGKVQALAKGKTELTVTSVDGNKTKKIYLEILPADLEGITMDQPSLTMIKGTQHQLSVIANAGSELSSIEWASSNESVATVVDGKVTAVSKGTAKITATSDGFSTSCELTVVNGDIKIESIKLTASRDEVEAGQTVLIHAAITPNDAAQHELSWSSSDPSIADVLNEAGSVAAIEVYKGNGNPVIISARAMDGSGVSATITITPIPSTILGIELDQTFIRLGAKDIQGVDLKASFKPISAHGEVTWELNRNDLINLTQTGSQSATIRPNSDASSANDAYTIITARSGDVSAQCVVLLSDIPMEQIDVKPNALSVSVNETKDITINFEPINATSTTLKWKTLKGSEDIILINGDARHTSVTGLKPGKVIVQAENEEGILSNPITILVNEETAQELKVYGTNILLLNDPDRNTSQLTALSVPSFTMDENLTWTSDENSIAEVDDTGLVSAISSGKTRIHVSDENGNEDSIEIIVYADEETEKNDVDRIPLSSLSIKNAPTTMIVEEMLLLEAVYNMDSDIPTRKDVCWSSSDENILSIDEQTGLITAKAAGTVTITLTSNEDAAINDTCEIIVIEKESISNLTWDHILTQMVKGNQETLTVTGIIQDDNNLDVIWTSSNPNILTAEMDSNDPLSASIKAISSGFATIYCQINGKMISQRIQVTETNDIPIKEIKVQELGNAEYFELQIGDTQTLTVTVNEDATDQGFTISSQNTEIVSWDGSACHALQEGIAVITIVPDDPNNKLTKTIFVRVIPQPDPILYLDKESLVMVQGETGTIRAFLNVEDVDASYRWACDDPAVTLTNETSNEVSISTTSTSEINTKIKVILNKGDVELTKTSTLRILPNLDGYVLPDSVVICDQLGTNISSIAMDLSDKSLILQAKVSPADALQIVNWTSSDPTIASIEGTNDTANVTPHQSGQVTITATTIDGTQTISVSLIITDKNEPKVTINHIGINAEVNELLVGESTTIQVTMDPESELMNHILTASKEGIVEINAQSNGKYQIKALKEGYVEISAAAINDLTKKDKVSFIVKKKPAEAVIFNSFTLWDSENKKQISVDTKIDALSKTIVVMIPTLQSKQSLIAHYTLSGQGSVQINGVEQENGKTVNNFDGLLTTYDILDQENNVTHMNVLVTNETIPENDGTITSFALNGVEAMIDQVNKTIEVLIDKNMDRNKLSLSYSASDTLSIIGANGILNQGSTMNYQQEQVITLIGKNGNAVLYHLFIDIGPEINKMELTQKGKKVIGSINQSTNTITFDVQQGLFDGTQPFNVMFTHSGLKESTGASEITFVDGKADYALSYEKDNQYYLYHLELNEIIPETPLSLTSFKVADTEASITEKIVEVSLPYGTDLTNPQKVEFASNETAKLFINGDEISNGSSYTFTANKIVSCSLKNDQKEINFSLLVSIKNAEGTAECKSAIVIAGTERYEPTKYDSIYLYEVPYETDLTKLKVELEAEEGAAILVNDAPYDVDAEIDGTNDIIVVIQKKNKADRIITLHVQKSTIPSKEATITSFTLKKEGKELSKKAAVIEDNIIQVIVPFGTDLTNVDYEFTSDIEGLTLSVKGKSETTGHDFSSGMQKLVAHKDGYADKEYTLIIQIESESAKITKMKLNGVEVAPNEQNELIFNFERGTDLSQLVPEFTLSNNNAKVSIDNVEYTAGTAIDFSQRVTITVNLNGIREVYLVKASITYGPQFKGTVTLKQGDITIIGKINEENGEIIFDITGKEVVLSEPFIVQFIVDEGVEATYNDTVIQSGDSLTFTSLSEIKQLILKDADNNSNTYKLKLYEDVNLPKFDTFEIMNENVTGILIDHESGTITIKVKPGMDVSQLKPVFTFNDYAQMAFVGTQTQVSGVSSHDFSKGVDYLLMGNGRTKVYHVVAVEDVEGPIIYTFGVMGTDGVIYYGKIDNVNKEIIIRMPKGSIRDNLTIYHSINEGSKIITGFNTEIKSGESQRSFTNSSIVFKVKDSKNTVSYNVSVKYEKDELDINDDGSINNQDVVKLSSIING